MHILFIIAIYFQLLLVCILRLITHVVLLRGHPLTHLIIHSWKKLTYYK